MDLRLVLISHYPLYVSGGIPTHLKRLAEEMTALGVNVTLLAPVMQSDRKPDTTPYKFPIVHIRVESCLETQRVFEYSYKVYRWLAETWREFDAVHGSQWAMHFPTIYRNNIKIPLVTKFHGTFLFGTLCGLRLDMKYTLLHNLGSLLMMPLYTHVESTISKKSDCLICISEYVKREIMALSHVVTDKAVFVIYNGVDTDRFKPLGSIDELRQKYSLSEEDRVVLFVGRLDVLKGVHRLITIAKRLLNDLPDLKVVVVGDGEPAYAKLLREAAKPERNFSFLGNIPHEQLPLIYNLADVFVAPSPYASGNVLLEAMACGKPVVTVAGSGFPELVKHCETGFIVNGLDSERRLEDCLRLALSDRDLCKRVGKNARNFAEKNLTWRRTGSQTIQAIQTTLE